MGLVLCLGGFAAAYAIVTSLVGWVSVSLLGWGDPKFGDTAGNLRVMLQVLPILVAIATLSAFVGARTHQAWMRHRRGLAIAAGSGAGALTAVAVFAMAVVLEVAPRVLPETFAMVLIVGLRILVLVMPAIVVQFVAGFMRPKPITGRAA